jgi:hypothetical protein
LRGQLRVQLLVAVLTSACSSGSRCCCKARALHAGCHCYRLALLVPGAVNKLTDYTFARVRPAAGLHVVSSVTTETATPCTSCTIAPQ